MQDAAWTGEGNVPFALMALERRRSKREVAHTRVVLTVQSVIALISFPIGSTNLWLVSSTEI
jgi:hypothetical protein